MCEERKVHQKSMPYIYYTRIRIHNINHIYSAILVRLLIVSVEYIYKVGT